jgi:putative flippase GtrA
MKPFTFKNISPHPFLFDFTFVKYCIIGVINTIFCFSTIFVLMYFLKINYLMSNIVGYAVGLIISFSLNKYKNFKSRGSLKKEFPLFLAAFGCAYSTNIIILWIAAEFFHVNKIFSQIIAGIAYTIVFYFFIKLIVFIKQ